MELFYKLLFLIVIGALIGGVTNSLAIKMLFRPYRAIYLFGWRLPFTPGLIPKRRQELAAQLGKMVMKHLLTADSVKRKLNDAEFKSEVIVAAKREVHQFLQSDTSLKTLLEKHFEMENVKEKVNANLSDSVEKLLHSVLNNVKMEKVEDVLSDEWLEKVEGALPKLSTYIADEGVAFVRRPEGKAKIKTFIDSFFENRGMLANMLQMFVSGESVTDKVQQEAVKFLKQPMMRDTLTVLLQEEWRKIKQKNLNDFDGWANIEEAVPEITAGVVKHIPVHRWLEMPLSELIQPYRERIVLDWTPRFVDVIGKTISAKVEDMLKHLHLEEVVRGQVETFAVERLEKLVLSISKREFKMITYLGAFLGGLIGFVQGFMLHLL